MAFVCKNLRSRCLVKFVAVVVAQFFITKMDDRPLQKTEISHLFLLARREIMVKKGATKVRYLKEPGTSSDRRYIFYVMVNICCICVHLWSMYRNVPKLAISPFIWGSL